MSRPYEPLHNFAARCPNGHRPPQTFTLAALQNPKVRFHCHVCETTWSPDPKEHGRALGFAACSEHQYDQPLSAA